MEVGIPWSLWTPDNGEIVFNVLSGDATGKSLAPDLGASVYPVGLPDGNGYLMTNIVGADGASIRNPFHNRPHAHGGVVHRFRRTDKVIAIEGLIVATKPEYRSQLVDALRNACLDVLSPGIFGSPQEVFGRLFWQPVGSPVRYHKIHLSNMFDAVGPAATEGGSTQGIAGPKTYSFELTSEHPEALKWAGDETDIDGYGSGFVPNDGNTETWPVVQVFTSGPFTLFGPGPNGEPSGRSMRWGFGPDPRQDPPPIDGTYIEIDMFRQTMYWDGDGDNALAGLDMSNSDFFSIPAGGGDVSTTGAASAVKVFSNTAWVG